MWSSLLVLILAVGCSDDGPVPFPDGLEPLEANTAPWPDSFDESISTVSGEVEGDEGYLWAHGRGYVHADVDEVWLAMQQDEVLVDRREVTSWTSEPLDADVDFALLLREHVENVIDFDFEIEWRQGVWETASDTGDVHSVAMRWQRTDGTDFLELLQGSVVVAAVHEDELAEAGVEGAVTTFEVQEHLRAALQVEGDIVQYFDDLHKDVVAQVHGQPLPSY